ncbi:MAG: HEAT repeat domain-containing protein [Bradymonadales bacterium]|nr:HEAT repeat domain-containing protein [Bradymonadales bacterium]
MPLVDERQACCWSGRRRDFTLPGAEAQYPPDLELEPVHLELDLFVDLERRGVNGSVTTTVRARPSGPRSMVLDAVDFTDLALSDVQGKQIDWSYDGKRLRVTWVEPFVAGEERRLKIGYRVERPVTGIVFSRPSEAYPQDGWFAVTDHETERARHWLPCIDLPNVRTTLDIRLRAEERFAILANGTLVEETVHGDGTKAAHWRLEQRCPSYLVCFAVGDFTRADDGEFEGRPVAYFARSRFPVDTLMRTFGRTRKMLAWMSHKLDSPFPFPKYFQVAVPGMGGAMENISLVTWSEIFLLDETLAAEWGWLADQVNLHEMAHSYFGDWIVCRDFAHAWLKESWAVYLETCWLEDEAGEDQALWDYYANAQAYFAEADEQYKRPIVTRLFHSSWDLYDRHLYQGGACRLHTLRRELGEEPFWAATRDYVATFGGKVVETDDFRQIMERHSGRSLGRFFQQWFYSKGYPSLKVSFDYDQEKKQGTFEIEQTQVDEKEEIPAFQLKLDLGWVIEGRLSTRTVEIKEPKQVVVVAMEVDPQQVRIDPHAKVLHKLEFNPGDDKLRTQLVKAPDVIGRIQAGNELARTGKTRNIQAIEEAYRAEPFWGVRREWARALGKAGVQEAAEALTSLVGWEQDPMVLEPLLRSAGQVRDPALAAALEARLAQGLPYRATQACYEALGKQRDGAPFPLLAEVARVPGYHGIPQVGAFRGLAASRNPRAIELLAASTVYGACPWLSRAAAVSALADLGALQERGQQELVRERLIDLLRDPEYQVRMEAVRGLATLADGRAIPALEAFGAGLSEQDRSQVNAALNALRQGEKPRAEALEKQIERLEDKLRKLEDTLRKLEAKQDARSADG